MKILIVGATSGIGQEIARLHAARGDEIYISARDKEELSRSVADLKIRGAADVHSGAYDLSKVEQVTSLRKDADKKLGLPLKIYLAAAMSGDYPDVAMDEGAVAKLYQANAAGPIALLNGYLKDFAKRGKGQIIGLSSVAALKGKGNNPVYAGSKAALNVYLEGLRNGFKTRGVEVLTVYPGFTDTGLTFGMKGLMFLQSPQLAAADIVKAADKKKDILYTPRIWWLIIMIFKHLPGFVYNKKPFISEEEVKDFLR